MKAVLPLALCIAAPAFAADAPPLAGTRLDVSTTAAVTRAPDMATIGTGVTTQARTAAAAMSDNAARMTAVIAALRHAGVAARDIQTGAISLGAQYRYPDNQAPVLTGYQASNRVSVRLHDIARVGTVLDALVDGGANQIDGPEFSVEHPEAALDQARVQALADARARAELYAKAAGLHVRRIVAIVDGNASPPPVVRPLAMMAMREKAATPVEAGEQSMSVTLSVQFELE